MFNLFVVGGITGMSTLVALVTFGALESKGESIGSGFDIGGAIVGFLVTFSVLAGLFRWLRANDLDDQIGAARREAADAMRLKQAEVDRLKSRADELQSQLLRGSTVPDGYISELLEHQKLVLARPESFTSRGGVILDIERKHSSAAGAELETEHGDGTRVDLVPSRLYVNYTPAPEAIAAARTAEVRADAVDEYYRDYAQRASENGTFEVMSMERTLVGSEERARPALRIACRFMARVTVSFDPVAEVLKLAQRPLPLNSWPERPDASSVTLTTDELADSALQAEYSVVMRRTTVVCLHPALRRVFFFVFEDDEEDFVEEVEALNVCLRSARFLT